MAAPALVWNSRGSEWSRWDPHIHAPGTANNDQFKGDWTGYVAAINATVPPIRALGITDYYSLETYREVRRRHAAGEMPRVSFIFPNIEVRLDVKTAKGKGINLHLLFSPDDPKHEEQIERVLGELSFEYGGQDHHSNRAGLIGLGRMVEPKHVTDPAAFAEGAQQFKVAVKDLRELFRRDTWLRENCLIAIAAGPNDGTSGLQGDDAFKAFREEMQRFSHIIFSGNPGDREFWLGQKTGVSRAMVEKKYGACKPCLHGCDAHDVPKVGVPDEKRLCWIKGDLAFESLRQAVIEPEQRVWIGETAPLGPLPSVTLDILRPTGTPWLTNREISLNDGVVAIIGARGSGKTALADLIAAGASALTDPLAEASFLRRATEKKDLIGSARVAEVWRDGNSVEVPFRPPAELDLDQPAAAVRYLSQQFVDRLCSSGGLATELRAEIERVIFDQTDPTLRFETDSFASLAAVQLDPIRHRRKQHRDAIASYSLKIAEEQRLHGSLSKLRADREAINVNLTKQRKDLEALLPKGKEERAKRLIALEAACTAVQGKIEVLRKRISTLDDLLADANHLTSFLEPDRFAAMRIQFGDAGLTEIEWKEFQLKFAGDPKAVVATAKAAAEKQRVVLQDGDPTKPFDFTKTLPSDWPLTLLRVERDKVKGEVGVDKERMTKYEALRKHIAASEAALKKVDAAIAHAEKAEDRRKDASQSRRDAYRAVFETFQEEEKALARLYEPLHAELKEATGSLAKLRFRVQRHIDFEQWVVAGEALLDLRKESPFRGQGALAAAARAALLPAWQAGVSDAIAEAIQQFVASNSKGLLAAMPNSITTETKAEWLRQLGNWLFSTSHVSIHYGLEYDGTNVEQLSPGTRGIVLLLLYLAIDRNDRRPLLIDQPEENLDPKSVFDDLVPHFREARQRRQVIIVTHNANLVVNTDADQVIVATAMPAASGGLPIITYTSGSLENPVIRQSVCDILEGGTRAFLERERRYRLQWEKLLETNP